MELARKCHDTHFLLRCIGRLLFVEVTSFLYAHVVVAHNTESNEPIRKVRTFFWTLFVLHLCWRLTCRTDSLWWTIDVLAHTSASSFTNLVGLFSVNCRRQIWQTQTSFEGLVSCVVTLVRHAQEIGARINRYCRGWMEQSQAAAMRSNGDSSIAPDPLPGTQLMDRGCIDPKEPPSTQRRSKRT